MTHQAALGALVIFAFLCFIGIIVGTTKTPKSELKPAPVKSNKRKYAKRPKNRKD